MTGYLRTIVVAGLALLVWGLGSGASDAHPMDEQNAAFVQAVDGPAIFPFLYLGAKHMVTGYDHLLFLVGVIFFLYKLRDVVLYVSLFTVGHSATLLFGVLADIGANAYLVDAIIGLSVAYKAFDNMGGFQRLFGVRPDPKASVLVFGLFHGFGLATKVQEFTLSEAGAHHEHGELQRWCGGWAGPRAVGRAHAVHLLAQPQELPPTRLRDERVADDRWVRAGGLSDAGLLAVVVATRDGRKRTDSNGTVR